MQVLKNFGRQVSFDWKLDKNDILNLAKKTVLYGYQIECAISKLYYNNNILTKRNTTPNDYHN